MKSLWPWQTTSWAPTYPDSNNSLAYAHLIENHPNYTCKHKHLHEGPSNIQLKARNPSTVLWPKVEIAPYVQVFIFPDILCTIGSSRSPYLVYFQYTSAFCF